MRARLIFVVNLLVGLGVLALVLRAYGGPALEILAANPSAWMGLGFAGAVLATVLCLSWRWGYVMGGGQAPLGLVQLSLFRSAAHTLAVLVPSGKLGGDPLRAWLAARAGVPAGASIAGVAVDRTLEIGSSAPFSVLFAVLLLQHGVPRLEQALVTVVLGTLALMFGVWIAVRRLRAGRGLVTSLARKTRLDRLAAIDSTLDVVHAAERETTDLVSRTRRMAIAFAVGLVANLLVILEFYVLLRAFGLPSDTTAVVAAIFATGASHMLPIPAGIGVLEGAQIWIFQMLGYSTDVGLAVGLAVRLREMLWMAPGVVYLLTESARGALTGVREAAE